ncbi:hypothetical protein DSECCO2_645600 [anaerobic digester metagenome]
MADVIFHHLQHLFCQFDAALAAFGEVLHHAGVKAAGKHKIFHDLQFFIGIAGEAVDGDHGFHAEFIDIFQVLCQVVQTFGYSFWIYFVQILYLHSTVDLKRAHGGYQHNRVCAESAIFAYKIEKLFRTQIKAKASFCDYIITQAQCGLGGQHTVCTLGNIGKGTPMHQGWSVLCGLHQVWLQGVLHKGGNGPFDTQLMHSNGFAIIGKPYCDLTDAFL